VEADQPTQPLVTGGPINGVRSVARVVYRLLKASPDEAAVESVVRQVLPELSTLSAKLELISVVGHRGGRGEKLVAEAVASQLEQSWRAEVRAASVDHLIAEPELLTTLYSTHREAEPGEDLLSIEDDPRLTAAILRSAQSESRIQAMGSRAVGRSPRLAWDMLVDIYGDEATLKTRLNELRQSDVEVNMDLMSLADKYVSGWRPDRFE
jgi:hypothetical protein